MLLKYSLNINSFQYMHISFLLLCLQRRIVHTVGVVFSNPQLKHLKHLHKLQISTVFFFYYFCLFKHCHAYANSKYRIYYSAPGIRCNLIIVIY